MVDEREDRYEGEEGEYHFSDEQANYEEVEAPKAAKASSTSIKQTIVDKLSGLSASRRMLLAGVVFVSLITIIYKMLLPSSAPTDEISQITPIKTSPTEVVTAKPVKPVTPITPITPVATAITPATPVIPSTPATTEPVQQPSSPVTSTTTASLQPTSSVIQQQPGMVQPAVPSQPPLETVQSAPPSASYPAVQTPIPIVPSPPVPQASQNVVDRVKAVEDRNAAMASLLQTEYAQKISDVEMQSSLVRGKMDEMAKRINRIETSLNQITQLLQQNAAPAAAAKSQAMSVEIAQGMPASRSMPPKVAYTVQAIIPGRAWLKADTGDTVTVAEGDTLRDYGRISKIDPYDGVVEIDTGNKIIALSYGMSAE